MHEVKSIPPKLAAALVLAQSKSKSVALDAENTHHGYKYASAESIIEEAREVLPGCGVALVPEEIEIGIVADCPTMPVLRMRSLAIHESGECLATTISVPVCEGKGRPLDKAAMASLTVALSYQIRGLLLLPRVDNERQVDQRDDREYVPDDRTRERDADSEKKGSQEPSVSERAECEAFLALIEECARTKDLDGLVMIPKKVDSAKLPDALRSKIIRLYNPTKRMLEEERRQQQLRDKEGRSDDGWNQ